MDGYAKWLIRSRLVTTVGTLIAVAFVWVDVLRQWPYSHFVALGGLLIALVGTLDSVGIINRRKVRRLIDERNQENNEKFKSKQPWENK